MSPAALFAASRPVDVVRCLPAPKWHRRGNLTLCRPRSACTCAPHPPSSAALTLEVAEQRALELTAAGDAALDDASTVEDLRTLGESVGANRVNDPAWNTGCFKAVATSGRLRTAVTKPELSLSDLSFGLFAHPGRVSVRRVRIYKGHDAGAPDAYAVRTHLRLSPHGVRGKEVGGINTVLGTFRLVSGDARGVPSAMEVTFDRVALEMWSCEAPGGEVDPALRPQHVMRLPSPARATLAVLLQTPNVTVTTSNLGSVAVLVRCSDDEGDEGRGVRVRNASDASVALDGPFAKKLLVMVTSVGAPAAAGRGVTVSSPGQRTGSSSPLEGGLHHSPGVPKALANARPALVASRRGAEDEAPVGSLGAAGCGDDTLVAFGGRTPVLGSSLGRSGGASASRRPSLDARAQVVGFGATPTADVFGACPDGHSPAPPRGAARCGVPTAAGLLTRQLSDADALLRTPLATLLASAEQCQHDEADAAASAAECAARERYADVEAALFKSGHAVCVTPLVRKAFAVARSAHDGQTRKSGESVLSHAVATALILADLGLDDTVVAAGLLHDTLDDTMLTSAQLEALFPGTDVPALVAGVTSMSGASQLHRDAAVSTHPLPEEEVAGMRAMLLAMADVRVVIVKLADRLHNMRTLTALPPASQQRMAAETLAVFAPLASRLGVWSLKAELEDLCFGALHPVQAALLGDALNGASVAADVAVATTQLRERLGAARVGVLDLVGRPKNLYSTWGKLHRKGALGDGDTMGSAISSAVLDARGLRCIVADEAACYAALEVVHSTWPPLHGKVKDYIASPKANGYRSLHTVVSLGDGRSLEVQLRTPDMHAAAEYGLAAHWRYKQQSGSGGEDAAAADDVAEVEGGLFLEQQVHWARFLLTWQRDASGGPRADACMSAGCVFPVHRTTCPHAGHGPLGMALPPPSGAPDAKDAPVYVMVRDCTRPAGQAPRFRVVALPRGPGALKALRDTVGPVPTGAVVLVNTHPRDDIRLSGPSPPGSRDMHLQLAAGDLVDIVWGPDAAPQAAPQQRRAASKGEATREAIVAERARLMSTIGLEPLRVQA